MADILSRIEEMLDGMVFTALREEADERGLQLKTAEKIKKDQRPLRAGEDVEQVDEAEEEEEETKTKSDSGGDMSRRQVTVPDALPNVISLDMVVHGIDSLRSARSLKDPAVFGDLQLYWDGLNAAEKVALLAFINGLAETLIGGEGERSRDPSDAPYNVEMSSEPKQTRHPPKKSSGDREKTQKSDTPIVIGGQ